MQTITEYRSSCRTILGDENARRFSDPMLDMGIREALDAYRQYCPKKEIITAAVNASEGGAAILPWLFGADTEILDFRRKKDGWPFNPAYELRIGYLILRELVPGYLSAGDEVEITINGRHTVKGLDEGKITTIPDGHALTVQTGAAGYAMRIRARSVTEVFGKRPEDREALSSQANRLITDYLKELGRIARNEGFKNDPW